MEKENPISIKELELFTQRLSKHPELYEQFRRILDLSDPAEGGKGLNVHMLEGLLVPEIRKTGRVAISEYAKSIEEQSAESLKQNEEVKEREKKR